MKRSIVSLILLLSVSIVVVFAFQFRADNDDATWTFTVEVAQDAKGAKQIMLLRGWATILAEATRLLLTEQYTR